jgi:hypothetical protein
MRTNYISITQAIDLFETHKSDLFHKYLVIREDDDDNVSLTTPPNSVGFSTPPHIKFLEATTDFFLFIKEGKLELYGCSDTTGTIDNTPDPLLMQLPEEITRLIQWDKMFITNSSYVICNNYDYRELYNHSTNYDVLRQYPNMENIYTHLSVRHAQLVELMKSMYKEEKTTNTDEEITNDRG